MAHPLQPIADFAKLIAPHYTTMLVSSAVLIMLPYFMKKYYPDKESMTGILQGIGFFWGLLAMYSGIAGLYYQVIPDLTTFISLLVAGMTLNMQPTHRIPWSPVVGTVGGVLGGGMITSSLGVEMNWQLLATVTIVLSVVFWGIARYFEDWTKAIGNVFSFAPLGLALSGFCLLQGVLLLNGMSLHDPIAAVVNTIVEWFKNGVFP